MLYEILKELIEHYGFELFMYCMCVCTFVSVHVSFHVQRKEDILSLRAWVTGLNGTPGLCG